MQPPHAQSMQPLHGQVVAIIHQYEICYGDDTCDPAKIDE